MEFRSPVYGDGDAIVPAWGKAPVLHMNCKYVLGKKILLGHVAALYTKAG